MRSIRGRNVAKDFADTDHTFKGPFTDFKGTNHAKYSSWVGTVYSYPILVIITCENEELPREISISI